MAEKDNITKFYCYAHRTADTNHVFYIGKGHGNRAYSKQRSKYWHNKANKHGHIVEIISSNLSESQSFDMEREYIAFYGRDKLVNLTDGGEGPSGTKRSEETKKLMSKNNGMRKEEHRIKVSIAKKGMKRIDLSINPIHNRPGNKEKITGKNNPKARSVICIETGIVFDTQTEAQNWLRSIGFTKAANGDIAKCCKGKLKSSHGYQWKYAE